MKNKQLLILNILIITLLVLIRISVFGWILMGLGLPVFFPIIVLHFIATIKGFKNYMNISRDDKLLLWTSVILFAVFILFQYDMDDRAGYMVIQAFIARFFGGSYSYSNDYFNISFIIMIVTGVVVAGSDISLLIRFRRKQLKGKT